MYHCRDVKVAAKSQSVSDAGHAERASSLPVPLRAWSRLGRHVSIRRRLLIAKWLTSRLISSGEPYLDPKGFVFAIDPGDPFQAAMLLGIHDPVVEHLIGQYAAPGTSVIDAGANLGYFTLRLGRQVGRCGTVHAFECDPRIISRLERHVADNGLDWVKVNRCGVMDRTTNATLYLPDQLGWSSTLKNAWGATEATTVAMVSIDDYVDSERIDPRSLSFIKLDLEGCELQAVDGGRETLATSSAAVLIEFDPPRMRALGQQPDQLLSLMAELGFEPWSPVAITGQQVRLVRGAQPEIGEDVLFLKRSDPRAPRY
jgi:FkbM family methyltransferase